MGACFLLTWAAEPSRHAPLHSAVARWLPFVPETERHQDVLEGHLSVWSVYDEAARGSYFHADNHGALAFHGWWTEPTGAPVDRSVAAVLQQQFASGDFQAVLQQMDGDGTLVYVDPQGAMCAGTDFLGASHLYWGTRNGLSVVSNRAMVAAAALHDGQLPTPNAAEYAWLLSGPGAPIGTQTLYRDLHLLGPYETLYRPGTEVEPSQRVLGPRPWPRPQGDERPSWEDLFGDLTQRAAQITRLPGVQFDLTLTGGKDSRAVLAGLVGAQALGSVRCCYLESEPNHPDALVTQRLAAHYGLRLEYRKTVMETLDWQESQARHNFQVESVFNAYDRKGWQTVDRASTLGGNYGEIFKSHARLSLVLGPQEARRFYTRGPWLNRWGLLAPPARQHLARRMGEWLDGVLADGTPGLEIHDRWHRECRMHRWVGQAMQADGVAILWMHPLPGRRTLARYLALPLVDREAHRVHFELIRRADDWLWRQPFCQQRWSPRLTTVHWRPGAMVDGPTTAIEPAAAAWRTCGTAVDAYLRDRKDDGLHQIIDRAALDRLLNRLRHKQSNRDLTSVFGIAGVRQALSGTEPLPLAMAPR